MFINNMKENDGVVIDGRDICTNILPNAHLKIFYTATIESRARRACLMKNIEINHENLMSEVIKITSRDHADMIREHGPLKKAFDAKEFNTTNSYINICINHFRSFHTKDLIYKY